MANQDFIDSIERINGITDSNCSEVWKELLGDTHTKDSDCTVSHETGCCSTCGVDHSGGDCSECGGRGFHDWNCPIILVAKSEVKA